MSTDLHAPSDRPVVEEIRERIVLTGSCSGVAGLLEAIAREERLELRGWCDEISEAAGLLAGRPAAVLHATDSPAGSEAAVAAIREHTDAPVILVAPAGDDAEELHADGAAAVLRLPVSGAQVAAAVRAANNRGDARSTRPGESRTVTVFSPKGGTGTSVIAANLAVALAADGVRTLLVDLQLERGDAALLLGIEPERTIYDLVHAPGELDADKVAGYATRHASGLDILAAPLRPEQGELVGEDAVGRVLELAAESYAAVVVDAPASFHPALLAALDRTDELLLLCELDVATLKNARLALETLRLIRFPAERISLLLNETGPMRALKRSELETGLGSRVRFEVPFDEGVPSAAGRGTPLVLERGDFARAVAKVAWELVPRAARSSRRRSPAVAQALNGAAHARRSRWPALRRG